MRIIISFLVCACFLGCNESTSKFELCSGKKHPYYHPTLEYHGGFYEIKKHYYSSYQTIESPNNTGIIKIRFNINCKGKTGNYVLETYSLDYKSILITKKITEQLLNLTKNLNDWTPAYDENRNSVNSHKFFAFKIVNGILIDILPK
tara:strand:- start:1256 stop:1696 length:441 start_codon:yes stop_codon:yes gene_type:complete